MHTHIHTHTNTHTHTHTQVHSRPALHNLILALHAAVAGILDRPRQSARGVEAEKEESEEKRVYRVEGTTG